MVCQNILNARTPPVGPVFDDILGGGVSCHSTWLTGCVVEDETMFTRIFLYKNVERSSKMPVLVYILRAARLEAG